jgi:hypothetical protein
MKRVDIPATEAEPAKVRYEGSSFNIRRIIGAVSVFGAQARQLHLQGLTTRFTDKQHTDTLDAMFGNLSGKSIGDDRAEDGEISTTVTREQSDIVLAAAQAALAQTQIDDHAAFRDGLNWHEIGRSRYEFRDDPEIWQHIIRDVSPPETPAAVVTANPE